MRLLVLCAKKLGVASNRRTLRNLEFESKDLQPRKLWYQSNFSSQDESLSTTSSTLDDYNLLIYRLTKDGNTQTLEHDAF